MDSLFEVYVKSIRIKGDTLCATGLPRRPVSPVCPVILIIV